MITLTHDTHGPVQFEDYQAFSRWCKLHKFKVSHMYKDGVDGWSRVTTRAARRRVAKAAKTELNVSYTSIRAEDAYQNDCNACAVISFAVSLQEPFSKAQATFTRCGRKLGKGTPLHITEKAYKIRGYDLLNCREFRDAKWNKRMEIGHLPTFTISQVCKMFPTGTKVIAIRRHILTIVDGVPQDWTKTNSRHQVIAVFNLHKRK